MAQLNLRLHSRMVKHTFLAENATIIGDVVIGAIAASGTTPFCVAT